MSQASVGAVMVGSAANTPARRRPLRRATAITINTVAAARTALSIQSILLPRSRAGPARRPHEAVNEIRSRGWTSTGLWE
jgi:hypothetical protein